MDSDQLLEQTQAEKQEVKGYFETTGFDRWNRIYSESDEVNKVQRNIRTVSYTHLTLPTKA